MKLDIYHREILNVLYQKYPDDMSTNKIINLLSDKDPKRFKREVSLLDDAGYITIKEWALTLSPIFWSDVKLPIRTLYRISPLGIDYLREGEQISEKALVKLMKRIKEPMAFISASFNDNSDEIVGWVRNRAEKIGINTLWLKEIYKARPTLDKIIEGIDESDCFIQILDSNVFNKRGEAGWIGNELGLAIAKRPGKNIAVFCEKGYFPSGAGPALTDIFLFEKHKLAPVEKKAEEYLTDLRKKIAG